MGNRKLPFGYQMRMGESVRREPEAKAVQDIFLQYTLGASLKEIAEQMSKTGPTYDTGKSWNKNMVARILGNPKYTGVDNYPKLVDIKLFEAAAAKRQTKQCLPERTPAQKALRRICTKPPTPEIEQQVMRLLGRLSEQPERITQPETASAPRYSSTQAELDSVLNAQPLDEEAARKLIFQLAQEQYDTIGNAEYETERLRRLFTAFECTAECNAELLQSAVSAVLVTRQAVRLQLKNGQIIGKDDLASLSFPLSRSWHRKRPSSGSSAWQRTAAYRPRKKNRPAAMKRSASIIQTKSCPIRSGQWRAFSQTKVSPAHQQKSAPSFSA